jgi:two-component system sensor histidine kinase KdpD
MRLGDNLRTLILGTTIGSSAVVLLTCCAFFLHANIATAGFLYLLLIVVIALRFGFTAATVASIIAVGYLDYYFIPPVYSLNISHEENAAALITFECTALIVSRLSAQAKLQASIARQQYEERQRLYQLSRGVLLSDPLKPVTSQILKLFADNGDIESGAIFDGVSATRDGFGPRAGELQSAARDAYMTDKDANRPDQGAWSRALRLGSKPIGAIALGSTGLNAELVDAIASLCAIAIERARALDRAAMAEASRHSEQLRSAVLDALAHAFKTPLTTIRAASSGLLEMASLDGPTSTLINLIDQESDRLNNLATQLLRTARLDKITFKPVENCDVVELIRRLLRDLEWITSGHTVELNATTAVCMVRADAELLAMGLTQLIDNAAKYSPPESVITVGVRTEGQSTVVAVHNWGPAIPLAERERIFDRFYRAPGSQYLAAGTGLGLSISRKSAETHGGRVWVESATETGTTFFFAIPNKVAGPEPLRSPNQFATTMLDEFSELTQEI